MARLRLNPAEEVDENTLLRTLAEAFAQYDAPTQEYRQPLIAIEPLSTVKSLSDRLHLTVIWDAWRLVEREERSRIIMRAYEQAKGREEALQVSLAMGLTQDEAIRLGINFEPAQE